MDNKTNITLEIANTKRIRLCKGRNSKIRRALIIDRLYAKIEPPLDRLNLYKQKIATLITPTALYWTELNTDIENNFINVTLDDKAKPIIQRAITIYSEAKTLLQENNCTRPEDKATTFLLIAALEALKEENPEDALTSIENNLIEPYRGDYARTPLTLQANYNILANINLEELKTKLQNVARTLEEETGRSDQVAILNPRMRTKEDGTKQLTIIYYTKTKEQEKPIIENGKVLSISIPLVRKTTIIIIGEEKRTTGYILYSGKLTNLQRRVYEKILAILGLPTKIESRRTLRRDLDPLSIVIDGIKKGKRQPHSLLEYASTNVREKIRKQLDRVRDENLRKALLNLKAAKLSLSDTRGRHVSFNLTISHEEHETTTGEMIAHTAAAKHDIIEIVLSSLEIGAENPTVTLGFLTKYKDRKVKLELVNRRGEQFYTHNFPKNLVHEIHTIIGE